MPKLFVPTGLVVVTFLKSGAVGLPLNLMKLLQPSPEYVPMSIAEQTHTLSHVTRRRSHFTCNCCMSQVTSYMQIVACHTSHAHLDGCRVVPVQIAHAAARGSGVRASTVLRGNVRGGCVMRQSVTRAQPASTQTQTRKHTHTHTRTHAHTHAHIHAHSRTRTFASSHVGFAPTPLTMGNLVCTTLGGATFLTVVMGTAVEF